MSPGDARHYQIGEVAEKVGLSLRTIRYYEEMDLVSPEKRTEGGFRLYSGSEMERLELIKGMKPLGFSIQEMRELLDSRDALRSPDTDEEAAAEAYQLMTSYTATAAARCEALRERLAQAELLTAQLDREVHRTDISRAPRSRSAAAARR